MKKRRRGVSLGTIVMLALTAAVLAGFLVLMPSFTGHQDIRLDAAKLAVAMDESLSQLAAASGDLIRSQPQATILPPESLATALPYPLASPTPEPVVTPVPKRSFTLCAGGSIQWNNTIRNALTVDEEYCFDTLTDEVSGVMHADLSIVTLEHVIIDSEKTDNLNMPSTILSPLQKAGVNTINIGHPDILNHGIDGLRQTQQAIRQAGMTSLGTDEGKLLLNGCAVMLLHYQDDFSSTSRKQSTDEERQQTFAPIDTARIRTDIAAAREAGAQVVVVSLRWGKDGAKKPTDDQIALAQEIADAGADIILGAGSGVLHPVTLLSANRGDGKYHPVLCAYSLGSLFTHERETRYTLASLLVKTEVIYDPVTDCVAFENLHYTPMYAWKGKQDGRTLYRILVNDPEHVPEFVDKNQKSTMEKSYVLVNEVMADTGVEMVME